MKELTQTEMLQVNGAGFGEVLTVVCIGVPAGAYVGLMAAGYTFAGICVMANNTLDYCGSVLNNTFLYSGENATNVVAGAFLSWVGAGSLLGITAMAGIVLAAGA